MSSKVGVASLLNAALSMHVKKDRGRCCIIVVLFLMESKSKSSKRYLESSTVSPVS